jgi:ribosomal protein L34E
VSVSLFPSPVRLGAVPAVDFGVYEVVRMASPREMRASAGRCAECGDPLVTKHGNRPIAGAMVGKRPSPAVEFSYSGPYCHGCEKAVATDESLVAA